MYSFLSTVTRQEKHTYTQCSFDCLSVSVLVTPKRYVSAPFPVHGNHLMHRAINKNFCDKMSLFQYHWS